MTNALWYAILLLLQIVPTEFSELDIFYNSHPYISAELSGSLHSGLLLVDGTIVGEYEASDRYRQVYIIFPALELDSSFDLRIVSPNFGSDINPLYGNYASGPLSPFLIDLTEMLSQINFLDLGEELELSGPSWENDDDLNSSFVSSNWLLRREQNWISFSNSTLDLVVIVHF